MIFKQAMVIYIKNIIKIESKENFYPQKYNQYIKNDILKLKDFVDKLNEDEKQMNDFIYKSLNCEDQFYKNLQQTIINPEKISKHQVNKFIFIYTNLEIGRKRRNCQQY